MATELTVQSERAFQKQPHIFLNHKTKAKSNRIGKGGRRWYKDVGLGFRTPKTAIEGTYIGEKCRLTCYSADSDAGIACRQEVPVHRYGLDSWPYPYRNRRLYENAPNPDSPPRIPSLHSQIRQIREATRQPCCACQSSIPC
jgi:hypothetical protein